MPRVYSQSQGKFVDLPYESGQGDMSQTPQTGSTQGGSFDISQQFGNLRNLLFTQALSDPKNASKYSTILNIAKPTASETKQRVAQADVGNVVKGVSTLKTSMSKLDTVQDIAKYSNSKKLQGQAIARLYEQGVLSDDDRKFYADLLPTWLEAKFLPELAKSKLDQLERDLPIRVGGKAAVKGAEEDDLQSQWEVVE